MLADGDEAPAFAAPAALPDGDIETVTLEDALASGPAVLAFFPGAFTSVCSGEMTRASGSPPFQGWMRATARPPNPSPTTARVPND